MGFTHVELGYDTRLELIPGIQKMVEEKAVVINSVHNFCPIPMGAHRGHPELFTFGDPDIRVREQAIKHTTRTLELAAELGARVAVSHSGNIKMPRFTEELLDICEQGKQFGKRYDKTLLKAQIQREKKGRKQFELLCQCVERLIPVMQRTGVQLALEILPTWEALPTELEFEELFRRFGSEHLRYWHDMGHAQIRQNLGFTNHERWLDRLQPHLAGMHVHDVVPVGYDHAMPGQGKIDYTIFKRFAELDIVRVIEPTPRTKREDIIRGLAHVKEIWEAPSTEEE